MRRSRRYRDIPVTSIDIETQSITRQDYGRLPEVAIRRGTLTAEDQRKRSEHGFPNWHINRGRISNPPTKKELRQISWRRPK